MVDTRAGFWLQVAMVALTVVVVVVPRASRRRGGPHVRSSILDAGLQPAAVLLPVVGILLVTSEWSQRTGLITFALVPVRSRVLGAKLLASVVLSTVALALCVVVAVVATAVAAPGLEDTWSLPVALMGQLVVSLGTGMVSGVAFGAALLASAPAIVLYFALPIGWAIVGRLAGSTPSRAGWTPRPRWPDDRAPDERHGVGAGRDDARAVDGAAAADRPVADHTG